MTWHCGRLKRWWHARLRAYDRQMLQPAIISRAQEAAVRKYPRFTPEWQQESMAIARDLWLLHVANVHETHWHCECAPKEIDA